MAFTIIVQSQSDQISSNEEIFNLDTSRDQINYYTWKTESKLEFLNHFQETNLDQIYIDLDILSQNDALSADSINNITSKISHVLTNAAENSNMVKKKNILQI